MSFKNTPPSVSTKLTFPCTECNFEAQSARQLSRHKAVTHTQNALKCVLCPFVTAYQTNLLRHRKDVHGICGSKGNKSCKFCGFVSEDNDTLIHHQIEFHQDILKSAQVKFAKELVSAGGDESIADFSANFESMSEDFFNQKKTFNLKHLTKNVKKPKGKSSNQASHSTNHNHKPAKVVDTTNNVQEESNEFDDFWKAGFMDQYGDQPLFYNQSSMALNMDAQNESVHTSSRSSTPKSHSSHNLSNKDLPATRIRRQYNCTDCGFRTVNPREFLYHRRDRHGYKIKIVECPYCVYACQYVQKLQRHLLLVHKLSTVMSSPNDGAFSNVDSENMVVSKKFKKSSFQFNGSSILDNENQDYDKSNDANDDNNSVGYIDYEHMNNFEMNFNEYGHNLQDITEQTNSDDKLQFNLECYMCKIKFGDAVSAQKHFMKNHKYSDSKSYMNLMKHNANSIQIASNQKKVFDSMKNVHSCNYCGYKTRWISELERHVRVHSKEKPFKCMYCDFKSKWKGDLNRHVQRYHSNEQPMPDFESDANAKGMENQHSSDVSPASMNRHDDEMFNDSYMPDASIADDYPSSYECLMEVDEVEFNATSNNANSGENSDYDNDESLQSPNSNTAKMYKCTYCDFMCSTASRFHVHYVQHLNTKPFQCSICGHRSNWEWDVTKHIKMKAQRDPSHEKARPVLIHDSGKRDYSKYNKFVVWVGQAEAEMANSETNKIDFRAKRFKNDVEEVAENSENFPMDSILTPEVCFEVDEEANETSLIERSKNNFSGNKFNFNRCILKSVIVFRHRNSRNQPVYCAQCNFKHQFARVMVAHMSSHFQKKPYACKYCDFETNWREVIVIHYGDEHKKVNSSDFEMHFRCAIDENSVCRIVSVEELAELETNSEMMKYPSVEQQSSLTKPNIYEEKAVIRCELCPFLTTNLKKMTIHCRFHNASKGSLKCKFCPYYVNNKDKLIRHQKLHQKVDHSFASMNNEYDQSFSSDQYLTCSLCSFKSKNIHLLNEHMKIHEGSMNEYNDDNDYNDNLLVQEMSVNRTSQNTPVNSTVTNELMDSSVSLIDVNNMKNGNAKKFSYVCLECPAAFKSPGDFKIHTDFHSSNYQHACPYCTYKARNKPQLCKHLYVHTAQYIAKRANSYPDGTKHLIGNQDSHINSQSPLTQKKKFNVKKIVKAGRKHRTKIEFPMKPVKVKLNSEENGKQNIVFNNTDLMASQEFLETKEYLQRINSGIKNRCMYRCSKCPAVFTKVNTLIYHMTLHEQNSQFTCESCNYSTVTEDNLSIHSLLHNLTESQSALGYNFNYNCHKCPAGFSKRSRLEKHLSLHGAKFNWKCDKCDYSVRYAATLVKHRALHLINPDFQAMSYDNVTRENVEDAENGLLPKQKDDFEEGKNDLKLKLNLSKIQDDDDVDNEVELQIDFSPSANNDDNSQTANEPPEEENDDSQIILKEGDDTLSISHELIVKSN